MAVWQRQTQITKQKSLNKHRLWTVSKKYMDIKEQFSHILEVRKKTKVKNQKSIRSSTTPDPGYQYESVNVTIRHHRREPRGPPFPSRWPPETDVHESITKQDRNNINDPQKEHRLGMVSKNILLEGLNRFNGAPTSPLVQMWIKTHKCLVCMKDP